MKHIGWGFRTGFQLCQSGFCGQQLLLGGSKFKRVIHPHYTHTEIQKLDGKFSLNSQGLVTEIFGLEEG